MRLIAALALLTSVAWANLPAGFEANQGQAGRRVRFLSRAPGRTLLLTSSEAVLEDRHGVLRMQLLGSARSPVMTPLDPLPGKAHYFTGKDPSQWRTNVVQYERVKYEQVYAGVDLVFYGDQQGIEYDFVVAPGADPARIRFTFAGAQTIRIDDHGDLQIAVPGGATRQREPRVYQKVDGKRRTIAGRYIWKGKRELGFDIGDYDRSLPLWIDPVLVSTSFLGGSGDDTATGVAIDEAGNIYVAGQTNSTNFPTRQPLRATFAGGQLDAFVAKISPDGRSFLYSTYLGGNNVDVASAIAVDSAGNAYVTGYTGSNDFPIVSGAFQPTRRGGVDAFVTKLNPAGNQLVYSTFLSGTNNEFGHGVSVDSAGNAYVAGVTNSTDFPVSTGAYDTTYNGGDFDVFLFKLDPAGAARVFATYLGGSGSDLGNLVRVALNPAGNAFLGGYTASADFPTTEGAVQRQFGGTFDGWVARFSTDGARLEYSTYLGGSRNDGVYGIALDAFDNLYVSGSSGSPDFPTSPGPPQSFDGFLARLVFGPGNTSKLRWVRFFGNEATTIAYGVAPLGQSILVAGGTRGGELQVRTPSGAGALVEAVSGDVDQTVPESQVFWANVDKFGRPLLIQQQNRGNEGSNLAALAERAVALASGTYQSDIPNFPAGRNVQLLFYNSPEELRTRLDITSQESLDPVATATGEMFHSHVDLNLGGPLPLTFERAYASLLALNGAGSGLGLNWLHNFDARVVSTPTTATVTLFPGKTIRFSRNGLAWQAASVEKLGYQLVTGPEGYRLLDPATSRIYGFDTAGALVRIEDRSGNALTVTPGPQGPTRVDDGLGRSLTFRYQGLALVEVAEAGGRKIQFQQTGRNLTQVTDAEGKIYRYSYAAGPVPGLLVDQTLPAGNKPVTTVYDAQARVARQTDSRGNSATIQYDQPSAGVTTLTDALSNVSRSTHVERRNLTMSTDAAGQSTAFSYDANNRLTTEMGPEGYRTSFSYDAAGNPTAITDAAGNTTRFTWTPQTQGGFTFHNFTAIDLADGTGYRMSYDGSGNLTSISDPAGKTWTNTYNSHGQVLTSRNPAGGTTTYAYNPDGTPATITAPAGYMIRYEYDPFKRATRMIWPDGATHSFTYNARNQLLTSTDARNKTTTFSYNDNGQIARLTDARNAAAAVAYDGNERMTALTDRLGKVLQVAYDAVGWVRTLTNPAGEALTAGRDPVGRFTSVADAAGTLFTLTRDADGEVTAVADALSNRWILARDARGLVTQTTEPTGGIYKASYDAVGRPTALVNPLNQRTEITWDPRDLPSRITMPGPVAAQFSYTDLGQLGRLTDPNGSVWTRNYDAQGRLESKTDPLNRTVSYAYGDRHPRQVRFPEGTLDFTYDAAGNLVRRQYSDATDLRFSYDDNNRLVSANGLTLGYDAEGRPTSANGLGIGRDAAGRIASATYAAGKTVNYTRNNRGLVTTVTDWLGGTTDLAYNANRQITSIRRPNNVTTQFSYDASGRLARIVESGGAVSASIAVTRDGWGRATAAERTLPRVADPATGAEQFAYDAAHQETGTATYDSLGRPATAAKYNFTWDLASRLTALRTSQASYNFSYDAFGLMVAGRHNYVWNYALDLPSIAVLRTGEADLRYFVHLPDGTLLYAIDAAGNQRSFYHFDETGNTVFLTGDGGTVTDSYGLTPYGEVVDRAGSTENPFVFQGRFGVLAIENTSLYYMRARFYDSSSARFLTRDPMNPADPRSANPYPFVWGDPVRYVDPIGLRATLGASSDGGPGPECRGGTGNTTPLFGFLGPPSGDDSGLLNVERIYGISPVVVPGPNDNASLSNVAPLSPDRTNLYAHPNPLAAHDPSGLHPELYSWALAQSGIMPDPEQFRAIEEWWHDFIGEPPPSQTNPQPTNYGDTSKLWSWALGQCGIGPDAAEKKKVDDWWRDWVDQSLARQKKRP